MTWGPGRFGGDSSAVQRLCLRLFFVGFGFGVWGFGFRVFLGVLRVLGLAVFFFFFGGGGGGWFTLELLKGLRGKGSGFRVLGFRVLGSGAFRFV